MRAPAHEPLRRLPCALPGVCFSLLLLVALAPGLHAQGVEFSRADRLAVLYSPQLQFTESGEPLIRIGIVEAETRIRFTPSSAVTLLPTGEGGAEIEIPGGRTYVIEGSGGQAGRYEHHVVVAEFRPEERVAAREEMSRWEEEGHASRFFQVGSLFAVSGRRFDTRRILVTVGQTEAREDAVVLRDTLQRERGVDTRLHSVLEDHPGIDITLTGLPGGVIVRARDILHIRGGDDTRFRVEDVRFDRGTRFEDAETREYVGNLIVTADRDGALALINEVGTERLLEGILPSEIFASAPAQALRAQAVAARTELLADFGVRYLSEPWMTCADQRCQVYRGVTWERPTTSRAVRETRGEVLLSGEQIINAFYSANNGGSAASNASTWGGEERPWLRPRIDSPDGAGRFSEGLQDEETLRDFLRNPPDAFANITSFSSGRTFRWETEMTREELQRAVGARYPDLGTLRSLEVLSRDRSGRVTRLRVEGSRRTVTVERELNVRRTLGGLRSALFIMEALTDARGGIVSVRFTGGGFGHGVGLCQSGAIGAAERGMDYSEIVSNYYPGTVLRRLY